MDSPTFLRGERLALRPVEPDDRAFLARHWNEPTVRRWTNRYEPVTEADVSELLADEDAVHFVASRSGESVGFVWLFEISDVHDRAELGYWIAPDEAGRGYATEAARCCLRYAFADRNLRRVTARVFEGNDASMRVLEKLGFREEGRLREQYYVDGEYVDCVRYGVFQAEFETA